MLGTAFGAAAANILTAAGIAFNILSFLSIAATHSLVGPKAVILPSSSTIILFEAGTISSSLCSTSITVSASSLFIFSTVAIKFEAAIGSS